MLPPIYTPHNATLNAGARKHRLRLGVFRGTTGVSASFEVLLRVLGRVRAPHGSTLLFHGLWFDRSHDVRSPTDLRDERHQMVHKDRRDGAECNAVEYHVTELY